MENCVTISEMEQFISTIGEQIVTRTNEAMIVVHATLGDVTWIKIGVQFCVQGTAGVDV